MKINLRQNKQSASCECHDNSSPRLAASVAAALILIGCGGGGGSSTPAPTPPALLTVAISDRTATGVVSNSNPITFDVAVSGAGITAVAPTVVENCDGQSVPLSVTSVPVTGGSASALPIAGVHPNGGDCTYTISATATNGGGTASATPFSNRFQVMFKYSRLNIVVFSDQNKRLGIIDGTTVSGAGNRTGYSNLALCGVYDVLLASGNPLASCVTPAFGNLRRYFPINPLTGELMAEVAASTIPTGAIFRGGVYGTFGDSAYVQFGISLKGMYIDVPGIGTYYFTDADSTNLRLTRDGFVTYTILSTCTALSCFDGVFTFSNP